MVAFSLCIVKKELMNDDGDTSSLNESTSVPTFMSKSNATRIGLVPSRKNSPTWRALVGGIAAAGRLLVSRNTPAVRLMKVLSRFLAMVGSVFRTL